MDGDCLQASDVKSFMGTGLLVIEGRQFSCSFTARQTAEGKIALECISSDSADGQRLQESLHFASKTLEFIGLTPDKQTVRVDGARIRGSTHGSVCQVRIACERLIVESDTSRRPDMARFHVVNLEFSGTESYTSPTVNGRSIGYGQLPLHLQDRVFMVRPVIDYFDILRDVKATRGMEVTATIETQVKSLSGVDETRDAVEDICILLSLARGCRVAAINCDVVDKKGQTLSFIGRRIPPKRYGSHVMAQGDLLLADTHRGESTKRFVESAFPQLARAKGEWSVDKAIEYYLDAKREGDEFEFLGLKMAVCMEFLRGQYLSRTGGDCVLSKSRFGTIASKDMKPFLKDILPRAVEDISQDQIDAILERLNELNRYSFGRTMGEMNRAAGARISDQATNRFVKIRNALVHQGSYDLRHGSPYEQYRFLDAYVYRFLLSILGHPMDSVWAGYRWKSDGRLITDSLKNDLTA